MRYSKKELKGLPIPKEIVVKSLAEYIDLFSNNEFENYIFRGEPTSYHDIISSALRNMEYPFIKMKNEFRREIFHRLAPDERNNFLAFAQHHRIPTNLIDFTRSPLAALFFACQPFHSSDERFEQERGFIYLLKDFTIITSTWMMIGSITLSICSRALLRNPNFHHITMGSIRTSCIMSL